MLLFVRRKTKEDLFFNFKFFNSTVFDFGYFQLLFCSTLIFELCFFCFQQAGLLSTLALCYSHKQRSNIQRNNQLNKFGVHTIALYSCLQLNSNSNRFFAKCFSWDTNSSWFVLALLAGFHATWNLPPVNLCSKLNTGLWLSEPSVIEDKRIRNIWKETLFSSMRRLAFCMRPLSCWQRRYTSAVFLLFS